jgi:LmbE family N-acetylglucosaminyl deacetylase
LRAADYLDAVLSLPLGSVGELTKRRPFVVLSPHPDDETLGAGGLMAAACAAGQRAEVVVITDGSGSHPRSLRYPRQRLIDLRRREVEHAATLLGLPAGHITHLGLPDTRAPQSGPAFDAAVAAITAVVRRTGAAALLTTWDGDPHGDHVATARMAEAVRAGMADLKLWAYPVWGWHLDPVANVDAPPPRGLRIDISRHQASKHLALAAHASQMTDLIGDDPDGFRFSAQTLAPFMGRFEYFIEIAP